MKMYVFEAFHFRETTDILFFEFEGIGKSLGSEKLNITKRPPLYLGQGIKSFAMSFKDDYEPTLQRTRIRVFQHPITIFIYWNSRRDAFFI
jgi:hypothetical protein